jgi:hypothetical protein
MLAAYRAGIFVFVLLPQKIAAGPCFSDVATAVLPAEVSGCAVGVASVPCATIVGIWGACRGACALQHVGSQHTVCEMILFQAALP